MPLPQYAATAEKLGPAYGGISKSCMTLSTLHLELMEFWCTKVMQTFRINGSLMVGVYSLELVVQSLDFKVWGLEPRDVVFGVCGTRPGSKLCSLNPESKSQSVR